YKRNTTSKMPEAHLVFLDEVFKGNSAFLKSLLTLINGRLFYNNGQPTVSPVMCVIGSSNEYPQDEGLDAVCDRFLLRFDIEYIGGESRFVSMVQGQGQEEPMPKMTVGELKNLHRLREMVNVPDEVYSTLSSSRVDLEDEGIRRSDRRFKQSLSILQAKALMEQRQDVKIQDILMLEHTLWENVEQKSLVSEIVNNHA